MAKGLILRPDYVSLSPVAVGAYALIRFWIDWRGPRFGLSCQKARRVAGDVSDLCGL
jgi:hypothetical protein